MKGYKGFNRNLKCLDKQYAIGKTFTEGRAELCVCGMHFCQDPIDVLNYYGITEDSRYCEVEIDPESVVPSVRIDPYSDTKMVCTEMTISKELSQKELINSGVEYIREKSKTAKNLDSVVKYSNPEYIILNNVELFKLSPKSGCIIGSSNDETNLVSRHYYVKLVSSGAYTNMLSLGHENIMVCSGDFSNFASTGSGCKIISSGRRNDAITCGFNSAVEMSGYRNRSSSTGDDSVIKSSGDEARVTTSGDSSVISLTGSSLCLAAGLGKRTRINVKCHNGVGVAIGDNSICSGVIGSLLGFVEWKYDFDIGDTVPVGGKFVRVDGKKIKPNTWYTIENGEVVEAEIDLASFWK